MGLANTYIMFIFYRANFYTKFGDKKLSFRPPVASKQVNLFNNFVHVDYLSIYILK